MNSPSMNRASLSASQLGTIVIRAARGIALWRARIGLRPRMRPAFSPAGPGPSTRSRRPQRGRRHRHDGGPAAAIAVAGRVDSVRQRTDHREIGRASQLKLTAGDIFVESAGKPLVVLTPHQEISGRSSHFDVRVDKNAIEVIVAPARCRSAYCRRIWAPDKSWSLIRVDRPSPRLRPCRTPWTGRASLSFRESQAGARQRTCRRRPHCRRSPWPGSQAGAAQAPCGRGHRGRLRPHHHRSDVLQS